MNRNDRFKKAITDAKEQLKKVETETDEYNRLTQEVVDIHAEYQEAYDELSEKAQEGEKGQILNAINEADSDDIDITTDFDGLESTLTELEQLELPA